MSESYGRDTNWGDRGVAYFLQSSEPTQSPFAEHLKTPSPLSTSKVWSYAPWARLIPVPKMWLNRRGLRLVVSRLTRRYADVI